MQVDAALILVLSGIESHDASSYGGCACYAQIGAEVSMRIIRLTRTG